MENAHIVCPQGAHNVTLLFSCAIDAGSYPTVWVLQKGVTYVHGDFRTVVEEAVALCGGTAELAKILGVSRSAVRSWKVGDRTPKGGTLYSLQTLLHSTGFEVESHYAVFARAAWGLRVLMPDISKRLSLHRLMSWYLESMCITVSGSVRSNLVRRALTSEWDELVAPVSKPRLHPATVQSMHKKNRRKVLKKTEQVEVLL